MRSKVLLILSSIWLLQACGSNEIDTVKNGRMEYDESYSIGATFDNRNMCSSVSWQYIEDSSGRNVVEYQCFFKGSGELLDKKYDQNVANLTWKINSEIESKQKELDDHSKRINENKKNVEKYASGMQMLEEQIKQIDSGESKKIKEAKNDIEWLRQGGIDERFSPHWRNIKTQESFIERGDSVEYRKKLIAEHKAKAEGDRSWILELAESELLSLIKQEKIKATSLKNELDQLTKAKNTANTAAEKGELELSGLRVKSEKEIKTLKSKIPESIDLYKEQFYKDEPTFVEYYQWTVDDDESFYFASAGLRLIRDDKVENIRKYNNRSLNEALAIAYQKPKAFNSIIDSKFYDYEAGGLLIEYKQ